MSKFKTLKKLVRTHESFETLANRKWFIQWLKKNMHIYNEFERYAEALHKNGKRKRYSSKAIVERMRWDTLFMEEQPSDFKISNNCTSYLSRLVMIKNPYLEGMFATRG